jgi:hypothetical protein
MDREGEIVLTPDTYGHEYAISLTWDGGRLLIQSASDQSSVDQCSGKLPILS